MTLEREKELFESCLSVPAEQRIEHLRQICAGDRQLEGRLRRLINAHERAAEIPVHPVLSAPPFLTIPERIGPYRILKPLGEGGMGTVFEAEQLEPVSRRVALKLIRAGMDSRNIVARFEAERQALAVMNHPNIARVLDAGSTEEGRPFFVMELVRGVPITDYCDRHRLPTFERLDLFRSLCSAVQHAHQKGVIHRDLKPSNILVTVEDTVPLVKVIDFGIAKAVGQRLTEKTLVTQFGQAIGTPAYMSPEQAEMSGLDVDTRTDIFSLGVLLYEVLVGCLPVDPAEVGLATFISRLGMHRSDPPLPSERLRTLGLEQMNVALLRTTDPLSLRRDLRGDLDCIVMKAMEKDRSRRYQTAAALADDLQRFLNQEPVLARPAQHTDSASLSGGTEPEWPLQR